MKLTIEMKDEHELREMTIDELRDWQKNFKIAIRGQMAVLERRLTTGERVLAGKIKKAVEESTVVNLGLYKARKRIKEHKLLSYKEEVL